MAGGLRDIVERGLTADASMKGPTGTSNYVVPERILMGNDPVGGGRLQALVDSGVTLFVDLRDGTLATNYVEARACQADYIHFAFHCEDYGAREKQFNFLYHLLDRAHGGDVLYIHDQSGHGRCGVVAACLLSALYGFPGMKCLNMIAQLHAVRENTEGADCPSDARSQELKAYVKEVARSLKYQPGSGSSFAALPPPRQERSPTRSAAAAASGAHGGGVASINLFGESPSKQASTKAGRFQSSGGKHGGGTTSINLFGDGQPGEGSGAGTPPAQRQGYGTTSPSRASSQSGSAAVSPAAGAQQAFPPSVSPVKAGRGRSCGGGAHQINIFGGGDDTPPIASARRSVRAGPPGSSSGGTGAHAASLIQQEQQQQPHQQQQQHQHQQQPAPQQAADGSVVVQLRRASPTQPWGLQLDGVEIAGVTVGSPAAAGQCPLGVIVAVDGAPVCSQADLRVLSGVTSTSITVARGQQPAAPDYQTFFLKRTPGQSWGLDVNNLWIVGVQEGSPAAEGGVPCGRLVGINGTEVQEMADCHLLSGAHQCELWVVPDSVVMPADGEHEPLEAQPLPEPFNTRDKAALAEVPGPTRTSNWVIRGRVLAGAAPDPRQRQQLQALAEAGVTTFVNLRSESEKQQSYLEQMQQFAPGRRLQTVGLEMVDGGAPNRTAKEMKDFLGLVRECCDRVNHGEVLYVHCKGGHGRTGMLVACMLATLYDMPSMKALNATDTLHSQRKDTEDQCSPQTQEQRIFVLEALKAMQA
eukprot:TRINITY_DN3118_c0_g3_i9.p2 TRINITY_DN3118_c0_g3~~TRINITY_DN3118_c0_g3_i9.p2  ORF type:complete len:755 (+),score=298.74 TRINITY_DN3118_c0_g3_i9:62-2326(+)